MMLTGGCSCGGVTVKITGTAKAVRQCWCRQCQQLAGGGPTHNAMFLADDVAIEGELAGADWVAASGNTLTHWRCAGCGNPVFAQSSARPQFRTIRLGVLDPGHGLAPEAIIWTADAPAWAVFDPALPRFERQPPPPSPAKD